MKSKMPPVVEENKPMVLVGCGILSKEVTYLINQNDWNIETQFLHSALHNYFDKLASELNSALTDDENSNRETIVFYGACHPKMDCFLEEHHTLRTQGQNCIVMLLGYELFMQELSKGAYFLVEEWANTWEPMITEVFGKNPSVVREIFHSSHKYILALRTPCSEDFSATAALAAQFVDLPLVWMDVDLEHLQQVLDDAITQKQHEPR
ncbi:MAG: DUF1638 domain-containing protein [Methylicorpusculum sp.]|uniref:DUF1638 domain-containing protein n=1 Tax=Methylicorpusculum sp. TaxID=2713644 RepID=UPI0027238E1F|nr:DUF1638 domain-containing protein [Methylicorpusculum sp.]MDO8846223.1 DUF1638 domain-containing protein [Methylicorpusculum sp.]MDO8939177.1 DUF1638 domain-containing protein [Methylicorpusculum sp.]MDP2201580.1 DUF1638 domain-containing protein [Methylicorpusculum sp.]